MINTEMEKERIKVEILVQQEEENIMIIEEEDIVGYSRRANRYRGRDKGSRLYKNQDYANNISDKSNDNSNSNDKSNQERKYRFEYNPDACYKCKKLGHFQKDCSQMNSRTKAILERKAKRERNKVNNIIERNKSKDEVKDENMGLNIQSQTKRNERQMNKGEQQRCKHHN